ncbi:MAG: FAD-dependent oxidoreductase [Candidatus Promineifilaceae bacterium]
MTNQSSTNAIVIGASMGGLLAARALGDHFQQVTLIERDVFPAAGANRKGVPQGKHTHILLEHGRKIMEEFLPGLTAELSKQGAVTINDVSSDIRWFQRGGYHLPGVSGVSGVGVSRPTLEALVRECVLTRPNIHVIQGCDVKGLMTTADKRRVTGVRLVDRRSGNTEKTMTADLIVDAGGRGSRSPVWLEGLGYKRPSEEEVKVGLGYTTCYYRRQPDHIPGLEGIVLSPTPPDRKMGVLVAQDKNRWVVTIGGYLGDHAPTEYQAFLQSAWQLPSPDIYNVIKDAEPLGSPVSYKFPSNLRRYYEKLSPFPHGYLVIGDALCSFNPIYGQGMTVAAMEAKALSGCFAGTGPVPDIYRQFFPKAAKIIDLSWSTAVGSDLSYPEIDGPRTPMVRFLNWYIDKLHKVAHNNAQVSIAFLKVINMVAPPPTLFRPDILFQIIKGTLRFSSPQKTASQPVTQTITQ